MAPCAPCHAGGDQAGGRAVAEDPGKHQPSPLNWPERLVAGVAGLALIGVALYVVIEPPDRSVALAQCPNAAAGCVVSVDNDVTAFAAVLAGIGAALALIGLLGVRFNRVKVGTTEFSFEQQTVGLAHAAPPDTSAAPDPSEAERRADTLRDHDSGAVPLRVEVREGLGERLGTAPIALTVLSGALSDVPPEFLRDYQSARKVSQHGYFMTHILGPATQPGQKFSVAIRITPHREPSTGVRSAAFYLGRAWGNRVFQGQQGPDGRFGIVTEAYGPFLALCAVEFTDGSRILLDHYCDFDMGSLLTTD